MIKVKIYEVLKRLVEIKPEYVFAMGRLRDDILPPIKLMFKVTESDSVMKKLGKAMVVFL